MCEDSSLIRKPRVELERTAAALNGVRASWVGVAVLPILLTILVITIGYIASGGSEPTSFAQLPILVYGMVNLAVVGAIYAVMNSEQWATIALFRYPTRMELSAGIGATVVGVVVGWPLTTLVADLFGVARYTTPSITTTSGLIAVIFGSVLIAPIVEEVLYRGLFVGVGLSRKYSPLVVGTTSLLLFAAIHVFTAGIAGVVNAFLLGSLLTWLRFRFDNLVGAWLMHLLNNALEIAVALGVFPSLYVL